MDTHENESYISVEMDCTGKRRPDGCSQTNLKTIFHPNSLWQTVLASTDHQLLVEVNSNEVNEFEPTWFAPIEFDEEAQQWLALFVLWSMLEKPSARLDIFYGNRWVTRMDIPSEVGE